MKYNELDAKFCIKCGNSFYSKNNRIVFPKSLSNSIKSNKYKSKYFIIGNLIVLLIGISVIVLWFLWDIDYVRFFKNYFSELKPMLWIALYGKLIIGLVLITLAFGGIFIYHAKIVKINAIFLLITGAWTILNDLFAIPGLRQHNYIINIDNILQDFNNIWIVIGVLQIGLAFFYFKQNKYFTQ